MKKPWLVAAIIVGHLVVVGLILFPGCRTPVKPVTQAPPEPVLPPPVVVPKQVEKPSVLPPPPVTEPPVRTWPAETTIYVVAKGDTLEGIARRHGFTVSELVALNELKNANRIFVGQKLVLPGRVTVKPPPPPKKQPAAAVVGFEKQTQKKPKLQGDVYVVKAGDSLWKIAAAFKTSVKALKEANGLQSDKLQIGQKLKIPSVSVGRVIAVETNQVPSAPEVHLDTAPVFEPLGPSTTPVPGGTVSTSAPVSRVTGGSSDDVSTADAAASAAKTPATSALRYRTYVVEREQDLSEVAMMWGVSVPRLKEVNNLTDTKLKPGDKLKIPITAE
ncbi:MAG: LysM peptidoglycan-binding domain-containing protein [Kiritimatiellia bacterium]